MNVRDYNVFFHTHTISGIIISAILYVIFFAGSFSFFRDEIASWQQSTSYATARAAHKQYDTLLDSLDTACNLRGRDISFSMGKVNGKTFVNLGVSQDTLVNSEKDAGTDGRQRSSTYFKYDFINKKSGDYTQSYDLAEFLYRLHFLAQLNEVPIRPGFAPFGYLIAGITSFIFLFALITGLLVHWDKLISNFFVFRPWSKWKTLWTDMHTALGVIGFPFQMMYAVTGIFLIINSVLAIPFSRLLYDGDADKLYEDMGYADTQVYRYLHRPLEARSDLSWYMDFAQKKWPEGRIRRIFLKNYGDESMHVILETAPSPKQSFAGNGKIVFRAKDRRVISVKSPTGEATYVDGVKSLIYHLHFGDFGGYPLKFTFFILGLTGCLVITSGILIWLVARDKKHIPAYKRRFNFQAANTFLAICLTMLPVTAATFLAVKINPDGGQRFIYSIYFYSWLFLSSYYIVRQNIRRTNLETLLLGSLLGLAVPVVNGICTGNWIWDTIANGQYDILLVDLLWLIIAATGFTAWVKIRRHTKPEP